MNEIDEILQSGILSGFRANPEGHYGGRHIARLEGAFQTYFGVNHAIALNSATAGLHAALIACGVKPTVYGMRVLVSPYTFSSSVSCVLMAGAKPIFVDIDEDTFCIDPKKVTGTDVKAIIPVHLMGHPCDMDEIMTKARTCGYAVIEDCAQAIGATYKGRKVGTIGDCGVFSFNQSKHINTGEGGMLITNNDDIARIVRAVRNHAEVSDPELKIVGYNYRMCEIEAALALEQFKGLDENIRIRNELASEMTKELSKIDGFTPPIIKEDCTHAFYTYGVKYNGEIPRDELQCRLIEKGVYFGKNYIKPLHLLPIYGYKEGSFPVAERMYREIMVTDILKPPLKKQNICATIRTIKNVMGV